MCGIAGTLHFDGRPASESDIERMTQALRHRGPDDQGVYLDGPVALGHRRLSIIDISTAGHQPMTNEDGTVWVTYNGEVYNFLEIRDELESRGHCFRSKTDSEVVVHAYEEWGEACLQRFNGMFAFALWDSRLRVLMLARDRLGIKPLFYYEDGSKLLFASELKAILSCADVDMTLDRDAVGDYFLRDYVSTPRTPFARIRVLPPAHLLAVSKRNSKPRRYWDVEFGVAPDSRPPESYIEELVPLVDAAVKRRLVSDVPLGAFLSGGIDSTAVVHFINRHIDRRPLKTFSVVFEDRSFDEGSFARLAAEREGTEHHQVVCTPASVREHLEAVMWHADNLTADISMVPMYLLARLAREHVTVVLSGDGGDELFGGYPTYQADRAAALYRRFPAWARGGIRRGVNALPVQPHKMSLEYALKKFVDGAELSPEDAHDSWRSIFTPTERAALLVPDFVATLEGSACQPELAPRGAVRLRAARFESAPADQPAPASERRLVAPGFSPASGLEPLFYRDLKTFLPDSILPKVDTMTMAHGLEAREPLLDYRLVELGARIPARYKVRGFDTKWIFKQAMKPFVPLPIVRRAKAGFQPPLAQWFRGELQGLVREVLDPAHVSATGILQPAFVDRLQQEHFAGRANHAYKLWSLMNYVVWWNHWLR